MPRCPPSHLRQSAPNTEVPDDYPSSLSSGGWSPLISGTLGAQTAAQGHSMNHPLAVYTVIYVAILFVTVSIWGGKIGEATGDYRVLLLAQGIFGLKLAIDDYVHFQGARSKLHADLCLSLLIYLLLAASIATAASGRGSLSAVSFALVFIVGALWLSISGLAGAERSRRIGWLVVNVISAVLLLIVAFSRPPQSAVYTDSSCWLVALVGALVFDFFYFGTLRRLAELHWQGDESHASSHRCTVSAPAAPAVGNPALGTVAGVAAEASAAPPKPSDAGKDRAAIVYDFDGTLARGNIQEGTFLPGVGIEPKTFWEDVKSRARQHDSDEILVYMWRMLEVARAKGMAVTRDMLLSHGQKAALFPGVQTWFDRINRYAADRSLQLDHYVISSGTHEMIEGCPIADRFRAVYASRFIYDDAGEAVWPGVAINYTTKTQYLFRINKGVENSWDNESVNRWKPMDERPVPFSRMIFVGDGDTDIPSMKMVRHQGGYSIGVFDEGKFRSGSQRNIYRLIAEDRVNFVAPANYCDGSQLDVTVKGILGRFARTAGYRGPDEG